MLLTRNGQTRRIPYWVEIDHPVLGTEPARTLHEDGDLSTANTAKRREQASTATGATSTNGDGSYPGPEVAYVFRVTKPIANFGVAVLSGHAQPHVVFAGDENHLVGLAGLPSNINPYLEPYGTPRPVAGTPGASWRPAGTRSSSTRVRRGSPARSRSASGSTT